MPSSTFAVVLVYVTLSLERLVLLAHVLMDSGGTIAPSWKPSRDVQNSAQATDFVSFLLPRIAFAVWAGQEKTARKPSVLLQMAPFAAIAGSVSGSTLLCNAPVMKATKMEL